VGVTGQLHPLPGGEIGENLFAGLSDLLLDTGNFHFEVNAHGMGFRVLAQFFQLALQFSNRFLEIKLMLHSDKATLDWFSQWGNGKARTGAMTKDEARMTKEGLSPKSEVRNPKAQNSAKSVQTGVSDLPF